jgi:hypothetical protein
LVAFYFMITWNHNNGWMISDGFLKFLQLEISLLDVIFNLQI